jgi:hypothetical protein
MLLKSSNITILLHVIVAKRQGASADKEKLPKSKPGRTSSLYCVFNSLATSVTSLGALIFFGLQGTR